MTNTTRPGAGAPREAGAASYDPTVDALYVRLSNAKVARTVDVRDDYIVDLDADGDPVGVEMLGMADDAVRAASDLT